MSLEYDKLDDRFVASIKGPEAGKTVMRLRDKLADGLFLRVTKHVNAKGAEQVSKSWEFYFTMNGKTSCTGLGRWMPTPTGDEPKFKKGMSVKEARRKAIELREMVEAGQNPVEVNAAKKAKPDAPKIVTFADAVDEYMKSGKIQKFRSDKHRKQYRSSMDLHALPKVGKFDVGSITVNDVKNILSPIYSTKSETGRKLRQRLERVFAWAIDEGHREHDNPASIKVLSTWIGNQGVADKSNHPAIQQADLPTWFADLRERDGMAVRALEFGVLCASRSGEVRGATWGEIDFAVKIWTIPASRMKVKKKKDGSPVPPHRVALSDAAIAVLKALPNYDADHKNPKALVFPAPRGGVMSDMTISAVMKRMHEAKAKKDGKGWIDPNVMNKPDDPAEEPQPRPAVPHGLRSTFKDFCNKKGFSRIQSEIALSHNVGDEVEQAYGRDDLVEERRAMMNAYAAFCRGEEAETSKVVPLRAGVA